MVRRGETVTGRRERRGVKKTKTNKQTEVTRPLGQNYAVAKQPGDSSKEPLHGRFPSLREGIREAVCMRVHSSRVPRVSGDRVSLPCSGMFWDVAVPAAAQQAPELCVLHDICSFFIPSFFWCAFYLFSNYVFIFHRVHRMLTGANILRCA